MKIKMSITILSLVTFMNFSLQAQQWPILQTTEGEQVNLEKGLYVINFWATWCGPCIKELDAINEYSEDWKEETKARFIAISIDDSRTSRRVKSMVNGKSWDFEIVLDENQDIKRRFNVTNPPHTFILKDGKIVYEARAYNPGDEDYLYEKLLEQIE